MLWLDIVTLNNVTDFRLSPDEAYWIFYNMNASFNIENNLALNTLYWFPAMSAMILMNPFACDRNIMKIFEMC